MRRLISGFHGLLAALIIVILTVYWGLLLAFGNGSGLSRYVRIGPLAWDLTTLAIVTAILLPAAVFSILRLLQQAGGLFPKRAGLRAVSCLCALQACLLLAGILALAAPWPEIVATDWALELSSLGKAPETPTPPSDEDLEYPELPLMDQDPYAWSVYDLQGNEVAMSQFKNKVVFLNFWATWCGFCKWEFPNIQRQYDAMKDNPNIAFVLLSPEDPGIVLDWAAKQEYTLPFYTIPRDKIPASFTPNGLPTTFIVAPDGRVAFKHSGFAAWDGEKTKHFLDALSQPAAAAPEEPPEISPVPAEAVTPPPTS